MEQKLNSETQLRRLTASAGHKDGGRAAEKATVKLERESPASHLQNSRGTSGYQEVLPLRSMKLLC